MDLAVDSLHTNQVTLSSCKFDDPAAGKVRIAVTACGICGSDLHRFRGHSDGQDVCPGHEMSGIVEAVGSNVSQWKEGDRVVVEPLRRCGQCTFCGRGDYHLCSKLALYGVHLPGGMATKALVPDYTLYRLPEDVPGYLGALAEPLAVVVHAARLGGMSRGNSALILGAGTIGILAAAAARRLGAEWIGITARHLHQKELAIAMGCDQVLAPTEVSALKQRPDVVLETVGGSAPTVADGVQAVRRGGSVVIVGLFEETPRFDPMVMLMKEVRLIGSMVYNRPPDGSDFEIALEILADLYPVLQKVVTHRFPLSEAQQGFETAMDKSTGAAKVLLEP